jgi:hypothetical protein
MVLPPRLGVTNLLACSVPFDSLVFEGLVAVDEWLHAFGERGGLLSQIHNVKLDCSARSNVEYAKVEPLGPRAVREGIVL